jgi:hypothetical protein
MAPFLAAVEQERAASLGAVARDAVVWLGPVPMTA